MGPKYIDDVHEAIANSGRPWSKRAAELYEKEGHWADYAAWQGWLQTELDDDMVLDNMDGVTQSRLYLACCKLADGDHKKTEETCR